MRREAVKSQPVQKVFDNRPGQQPERKQSEEMAQPIMVGSKAHSDSRHKRQAENPGAHPHTLQYRAAARH
jgi:hypothetical protein